MRFSFSLFSLIYLFTVFILTRMLISSEVFKALLALPLFLIIPIEIGKFFVYFLDRQNRFNLEKKSIVIIEWAIGIYVLIVLMGLFSIFLNLNGLSMIIFIVIVISANILLEKNNSVLKIIKSIYANKLIDKREILLLSMVIIWSLMPVLLIKLVQPFPLLMTHEYQHLDNVYRVFYGEIDYLDLGGINYCNHMIEGISAIVANTNALSLWWVLPFLFSPLALLGLYYSSQEISKRKSIALIAVLIGPWLFNLNPVGYNPHNIVPRFWLYVYFLFYLRIIQKENINKKQFVSLRTYLIPYSIFIIFFFGKNLIKIEETYFSLFILLLYPLTIFIFSNSMEGSDKKNFVLFMFFSFIALIFHPFESLFYVSIIVFYPLLNQMMQQKYQNLEKIMLVCIFLMIIFMFLQKCHILEFNKNFIITDYFFGDIHQNLWSNMSFDGKYEFLKESIRFPILVFVFLSSIYIYIERDKNKLPILFITVASFSIYFFPEGFFLRITHIIPFIAIIIGWGIVKFYRLFIVLPIGKIFTILLVILITVSAILPLIDKVNDFKSQNKTYSTFSSYEANTAFWVYEKGKKEINKPLIISDPYTILLLTGTTHSYLPFKRSWVNIQLYKDKDIEMMNLIKKFFIEENLDNSNTIYHYIDIITSNVYNRNNRIENWKGKIYFIISPRTDIWLNTDEMFILLYGKFPKHITPSIINKFQESPYFKEIYNIDNKIYIFEFEGE